MARIDAKQKMSSIKYKIKLFKGVRIWVQERKVLVARCDEKCGRVGQPDLLSQVTIK